MTVSQEVGSVVLPLSVLIGPEKGKSQFRASVAKNFYTCWHRRSVGQMTYLVVQSA